VPVTAEQFRVLLTQSPDFALGVMSVMARRLRTTNGL
jgi:CRP-like cAMP-binding protein